MPPYPQSDVDTLLSKMATERASLLRAAETLSAADADSVPQNAEGEEQWTAKEQLAHLWEMECSYIAWARAAIADDGAASAPCFHLEQSMAVIRDGATALAEAVRRLQ